ncbi:hypothetical protein GV827_08385 [Sulfitobacter sp. JBTF-M27]|jgi:hypothetical protein|uniref:Uncharacterized protein n=2 Tax=Sulfitobacter sediminilitoris TaxID=2698830 RepID=A0A6P0CB95_9RHOB|nr:hypothetical protein [Sulfitobacter sediminilitoris]
MSKIIHLRWLTLPLQFFAQVNLREVPRAAHAGTAWAKYRLTPRHGGHNFFDSPEPPRHDGLITT